MKTIIYLIAGILTFYRGSYAQIREQEAIPFEYFQGLIFFEIQTEQNQTLFCLLDTGAEVSAIDKITSERLHLPVVGSSQVLGTDTAV